MTLIIMLILRLIRARTHGHNRKSPVSLPFFLLSRAPLCWSIIKIPSRRRCVKTCRRRGQKPRSRCRRRRRRPRRTQILINSMRRCRRVITCEGIPSLYRLTSLVFILIPRALRRASLSLPLSFPTGFDQIYFHGYYLDTRRLPVLLTTSASK